MAHDPLLSIRDVSVEFTTPEGTLRAVDGVSYDVRPGEVVGVVGESGSGKSATAMAILGLTSHAGGQVTSGEILFDGRDLLRCSTRELRRLRGNAIAMIFQDPMSSLNPVFTVGWQLAEAIRLHQSATRKGARDRGIELLRRVGVPDPRTRFEQYPHQHSGGMRQRAMIAMAIANQPQLLIADEPTTALDVTIQAQVLDVLDAVRAETGAATMLITHDLGLIAEMADRVVVMYAGKVVETASVREIFHEPRHPYTLGLLSSLPRLDNDLEHLTPIPGMPPSLADPPPGCAFQPRCALGAERERCKQEDPPLIDVGDEHRTRCHFHDEVLSEQLGVMTVRDGAGDTELRRSDDG